MKASAVMLCVATISSLEPLQVIAPKEQPRQSRGDQHRWGNEQGQNPQRNRLEPLQVMAAPKKTSRWNRDGGKPYSRTEQPMQPWYDYPSGAYAAYPQNSQYNFAANMMPGAYTYHNSPSGFRQPPLPTSEENTGDQTLNNAISTALSMSTESKTALEWLERKVERNQPIQLEADRQEAQICAQLKSAIILTVNPSQYYKRSVYIWLCGEDRLHRKVLQPAIEKGDGIKRDAKLVFGRKERSFTLIALYKGPSLKGINLHAAFASKFGSTRTMIKSVDSVTLYEL